MQLKPRTARPLVDFARMMWARFDEDRCLPIASSLTFTTLLAIVPIITVALTLISAFPVFGEVIGQLETFLVERMVPESAQSIASYAEQFTENAAKLTAVGLLFLFVTAMIVLMTIDRALNEIWRVPRPRPPVQRAFIYWALLTVGPVLIGASLSLTSWVVSVSLGLVQDVPYAGFVLLQVVPIVLTGLAFSMLYVTLPNRRVLLRDALAGGFIAAFAFEATKHGFAFYITHFPTYKLVYGAFATIPIFLMWIYLSWVVVLLGAVAAAVLPEWRERESQVEPVPGAQFLDALQVLRVLWEAYSAGEVVSERRLHGVVKVPIHRIEAILETMKAARWAGRVSSGWSLTHDVATIRIADVYDLFVFRRDARLPVRQSGQELDRYALSIADTFEANLGLSVDELFRQTSPAAASCAGPCAPPGVGSQRIRPPALDAPGSRGCDRDGAQGGRR